MLAKFEKRNYEGNERVWSGRYRNLNNLPHWHLENELLYVEKGQAEVSHNHRKYLLTAGEAIYLAGGEIHYIKSREDTIVAITLFDAALTEELSKKTCLRSAKLSRSYPVPECFARIRQEFADRPPFYELQCCEYIISLMIRIFRGEELEQKVSGKAYISIEKYKNLLAEIEQRYADMTFHEAAAFMNYTESYFSRFFQKISGMTFSRYLNIVRLEHAIELLKENQNELTITQIAAQCGFETIRHFNRVFKDITGMSPRQLPKNYVPDFRPIRTIREAFNPTLQNSELL